MRKFHHELIAGIFVVIGLLCVGYMTVKLGKVKLLGDDAYVLYAKFTSVSGLRVGNPVEMFGLEVVRVEKLEMDEKDMVAVAELKIKRSVKVYDDAIASIKTAGLIGDRFVSVEPGGAGKILVSGGTIRDTEPPIDIGELIGKYAFGSVKKE